jgi:hypothetical protein
LREEVNHQWIGTFGSLELQGVYSHTPSYMMVMTAALYLGLERTLMSIFCFVVSNTQSSSCRRNGRRRFVWVWLKSFQCLLVGTIGVSTVFHTLEARTRLSEEVSLPHRVLIHYRHCPNPNVVFIAFLEPCRQPS